MFFCGQIIKKKTSIHSYRDVFFILYTYPENKIRKQMRRLYIGNILGGYEMTTHIIREIRTIIENTILIILTV